MKFVAELTFQNSTHLGRAERSALATGDFLTVSDNLLKEVVLATSSVLFPTDGE